MPAGRVHELDLSTDGARHAEQLGEALAVRRLACVYFSPLRPARLTAAPIARAAKAPLRLEDELQAIDLGARTGEPLARFLAGEPGADLLSGAEEGEGLDDVAVRVGRFLARVSDEHPGRSIVAVTHPEVVRAAVCLVLEVDLSRHSRLAVEPGGVTEILVGDWGASLAGFNLATPRV